MAMFQIYALDEQTKALPTTDTASGSIATFNTDLTENLVSVKCQIVAKQASGTPSPVNPLPIGVYDSLTLYHNDINMWDEQWEVGGISNTTGENVSQSTTIRSTHHIPISGNTSYYFYIPTTSAWLYIFWYDVNKSLISVAGYTVRGVKTSPVNAKYVRIQMKADYGTTYNHDISINYPSTDTQYHVFNGAYIPFGQTVANGVLDITTGKLRVTDGVVTDLSTLNWNYNSAYTRFIVNVDYKGSGSNNVASFLLCETYENVALNSLSDKTIALAGNGNQLQIMDLNYTDNASFKNSIQNVKLVYELATPIEIQLDSTQIIALLNQNNIWCDTGDTEVKFLLTVGKKIS